MSDETQDVPYRFVVRGYSCNFRTARPKAAPALGLFPALALFDNPAGETNRLHAVVYFHPSGDTLQAPSLGNNVIHLHYHESMCGAIVEILRERTQVICYLTRGDRVNHGGIETEVIPTNNKE